MDKPIVVATVSSVETERVIEVEYTWLGDGGLTAQSFWLKPAAGDTFTPGVGTYDQDPTRITDDVIHLAGGEITIPRGWRYRAVRDTLREVKRKQTTPA